MALRTFDTNGMGDWNTDADAMVISVTFDDITNLIVDLKAKVKAAEPGFSLNIQIVDNGMGLGALDKAYNMNVDENGGPDICTFTMRLGEKAFTWMHKGTEEIDWSRTTYSINMASYGQDQDPFDNSQEVTFVAGEAAVDINL